ncbi:hypothetical protein RGQ29_006886 [Quercus rubra]|uniref:DC1 domain-containing protein n=1 Tax=Quercus rubra TaxID=3512 RepID=A0AAN7E8X9_QUERU|nr:hypothetical protein RGQ29_006886 [Quercus rubra]
MLIELPELQKIDHFSHPHSLFLHKSIVISGYANCYSCWELLSTSSKVFNCSECDFYLHKSCSLDLIEPYRDYKHILNSFHNHPLEIIYYDREVPGLVCCTLCHICCFGPTYVCFLCNFFLHQSCPELLGRSTISQNFFHKHPLIIVENKGHSLDVTDIWHPDGQNLLTVLVHPPDHPARIPPKGVKVVTTR